MAAFLATLPGTTLIGDNHLMKFDQDGEMLMDKGFTVYGAGGEISHLPYQLNQQKEAIPSIEMDIRLKSLHNIDLNSNEFQADFDFWITGDSAHHEVDQYIHFDNLRTEEEPVKLVLEKYSDGSFLKEFSVSGSFNNEYNSTSYPFDQQELTISLELLYPKNQLNISWDQNTLNKDIRNLKVNGWRTTNYYVTVDNEISNDIQDGQLQNNIFESLNVRLILERNYLVALLQIILPLFFIGAISIGILYLRNLSFSDLGEVIVGLFLSIVAFSISLVQLTPKFGLPTKADLLFLLTFIMVFFIFIFLILLNSKYGYKFSHLTRPLRNILAVFYVALFLIISLS
jgi:hypothetical protein